MATPNPYLASAYEAPDGPTTGMSAVPNRERLRRVAGAQRLVNIAVLMYLAMIPLNITAQVYVKEYPLIILLVGIYAIVVLLLGAISVYRLASAMRGSFVAVLYVLGMLIPLLGLLLLFTLSSSATNELKSAGVKVGLMGANPAAI